MKWSGNPSIVGDLSVAWCVQVVVEVVEVVIGLLLPEAIAGQAVTGSEDPW